ncbi:GTPase Era [Helicobacter sp. 23-1044]
MIDGNSSLGAFFALLKFFGRSQTASLVSHPKNFKNTKSPPQNTRIVFKYRFYDFVRFAESSVFLSLRGDSIDSPKQSTIFCDSKNDKNNSCDSTKSRPLRGAKNREQGCRSATADFLLEAEKRGTPPKSEKAAAFWRVGGAGRGVQPFLREDSSESKNQNDENYTDSANQIKSAESNTKSQNLSYPKANCQQDNAHKTKCGFIALIGRPNAGKSTLLNALINENLALTSHKVNATRKQCNIIVTHENAQMIFIDTPGLHKSQKLLNAIMVDESHKAIESSDIVAFLAPISDDLAHYEAFLEIANDKKHIVLLTKIDLTSKANLLKKLEIYQKYSSKFEAIIPISATKRVNLEQIFGAICAHLPNSPFLYDSEILTSTHIREIYREKIRESLFNFTNKEVPYTSEVRILRILESENLTKIYAEIITEKTSQKKIIIGQGGKRIKNIGIDARKKIEEFSGGKVFLSLNVVCEKGWSKDKKAIEKMIGE